MLEHKIGSKQQPNITLRLSKDEKAVYFDPVKMRVEARRQVPDPTSPTGLRDVYTREDSIYKKFARLFTRLYDEIAAKESPVLSRLKEMAKAIALAKWIKKEGIPIDYEWINKYANKRVEAVDRIRALSVYKETQEKKSYTKGRRKGIRTTTHSLNLFGGVDGRVMPRYIPHDASTGEFKQAVYSKFKEKNTGPLFTVKHKGKTFRAVVLPITKGGQNIWKNSPTIEKDGIVYQFDPKGNVTKAIDMIGNTSEFAYAPDGQLRHVKQSNINGWNISGERNTDGSLWTITNPRENVLKYKYGSSGYLKQVDVDGKKWAEYKYDREKRQVEIQYNNFIEKIAYEPNSNNIRKYEVQNLNDNKTERLNFSYNKWGGLTKVSDADNSLVKISYEKNRRVPALITTPMAETKYLYSHNGSIRKITHSSGLSATYYYDDKQLSKLQINYKGKQAEYLFNEYGIAQVRYLNGGLIKYDYAKNGEISSVTLDRYGKTEYKYDDLNRLRKIYFPNGSLTEYRYEKKSSSGVQTITKIFHPSSLVDSKPITEKKISYEKSKVSEIKRIVADRVEDSIAAGKKLDNGIVLDLFVDQNETGHLNIVSSNGKIKQVDSVSKDLRKLIKLTAKVQGKLGSRLQSQWKEFYDNNLISLAKPSSLKTSDGRKVKIKPLLIIKSNEMTYKYANLEKVSVLSNNFIIFIASKYSKSKSAMETTAVELSNKIKNVPIVTKDNIVFAIKLPKMDKGHEKEWRSSIKELKKLVGERNVLFNPRKDDFQRMLHNRGKDIIAIELTHTNNAVLLEHNQRYTSKDVIQGEDLSHIKYLMTGLGTCSLPSIERGEFVGALREKGVGIINSSFRKVQSDTALKRLKELIHIIKNIERYKIPAYYLPDIIDQLQGIPEKGTTNLGKLEYRKDILIMI